MSPNVIKLERGELIARRERIVAALGMTVEDLRDRAENNDSLTADEWDALEDLDNIDFLLGGGTEISAR